MAAGATGAGATSETTPSHYKEHYENFKRADSYERAYFYEPGAYMKHMVDLLWDRLRLESKNSTTTPKGSSAGARTRCILDIGGGTGNFAQALMKKQEAGKWSGSSRIVVVDPFLEPTAGGSIDGLVSFVKAPAEDFLRAPSLSGDCWRTHRIDREFGGYDQILLKEMVHHLKNEDRVGIFRGMREGLVPSETRTAASPPSLLIITRPQTEIDYPLWDEARSVWKENQPSIEEIEEELREAGFTNLERTLETYPCSISLKQWQTMVKDRFWSTFSNFSDEELEEACERIAREHTRNSKNETNNEEEDTVVHFEDRLFFLTAS